MRASVNGVECTIYDFKIINGYNVCMVKYHDYNYLFPVIADLIEVSMTKYDIITTCPICNKSVEWINGRTNSDLVYIKTKRKSVLVIHKNCIENERKIANEHKKQ